MDDEEGVSSNALAMDKPTYDYKAEQRLLREEDDDEDDLDDFIVEDEEEGVPAAAAPRQRQAPVSRPRPPMQQTAAELGMSKE
jgi:hypothetical protein